MPRRYARNYPCTDCPDEPVGRPGTRCPHCSAAHRAARNTHYQRTYHDEHRPSPQVRPQSDPTLPRYGEIVTDDERIQCHVCGRWYGSLVTHVRTHGLDAARYKEAYNLPRTASLLGPRAAQRQRDAALARNQGEVGRANIPEGVTRPKGIANRLGSRVQMGPKKAPRSRPSPDSRHIPHHRSHLMTDPYDPSDDPDWDAWLDAIADWLANPDELTEEEIS